MIARALSVAMLGFIFWKYWDGTVIGGLPESGAVR
jgi:hypothetical protein